MRMKPRFGGVLWQYYCPKVAYGTVEVDPSGDKCKDAAYVRLVLRAILSRKRLPAGTETCPWDSADAKVLRDRGIKENLPWV